MGSRRKARILAFQALYCWDIGRQQAGELSEFPWLDDDKQIAEETRTFARLLVTGTLEHVDEIDGIISRQLENWDFSRLARVDLALLRMSVYSLIYQRDIPASVTIDEAVDIAKEFAAEESYRFINGVLDGIRKAHPAGGGRSDTPGP